MTYIAKKRPLARLPAHLRRALLVEDADLIGKPFHIHASPRAVEANTRHMALTLLDTAQAGRASQVAAFAAHVLDQVIAADVTAPTSCARGCMHCCTTFVTATIPEILNLARSVRPSKDRAARTFHAAARASTISQTQRETQRVICPMNERQACGAYAHRPLACRALLSTSLETCLKIFIENAAKPMPSAGNSAVIRGGGAVMLKAALILAGLPHAHYELTQGLAVALLDPGAEERWLAGEPIFDAVPTDQNDVSPSPLMNLVNALVDAVRPTL